MNFIKEIKNISEAALLSDKKTVFYGLAFLLLFRLFLFLRFPFSIFFWSKIPWDITVIIREEFKSDYYIFFNNIPKNYVNAM